MFRRSKPQHLAPAAPTFDQILEDLETFEVERAELQPTRSLDPPTPSNTNASTSSSDSGSEAPEGSPPASAVPTANPSAAQLQQWMRTFETFRTDCDDLHRLRRQLNLCRTELLDAKQEIGGQLEAIKQKVAEVVL